MTSLMIALVFAAWTMSVQGMSINEANYLYIFNGCYDNVAQYQADTTSYDHIQLRFEPLETTAFPGIVVVFNEWAINSKVFNLQIVVPYEKNGGLFMDLYNVTEDASVYKPGQYNVENVKKLKPEDIKKPSTCRAEFDADGPGLFVGTWPACRHYLNGKPALYSGIAKCNDLRVVMPIVGKELASERAYDLVRTGMKFKVPDLPDGFVNPCL